MASASDDPERPIRAVTATAVMVPVRRPLVTAGGVVEKAPLILLDITAADGSVGRAYVFTYSPAALGACLAMLKDLSGMVLGQPPHPLDRHRDLMARFQLMGTTGVVGMAIAGLDMAFWDLAARARGVPLAEALGASVRPIRCYNSNGLGLAGPAEVGRQAPLLLDRGMAAIKLRLGYADRRDDLSAYQAVRDAVGGDVAVMADFNQGLSVPEAKRRADILTEAEDLVWLEEPVRWDDHAGHAEVRASAIQPIMAGENYWSARDVEAAVDADAIDLVMPDVMKIGGVTGFLRAAAVADARGLPVSSHLFPEISAHLLAACPGADWLEYMDWAEPVLRQGIRIEHGVALPPDGPGTGLEWDEDAVHRLKTDGFSVELTH